ncbi:MAG: hypothetical protein DRJ40_06490 [Thermoprotei archaeon]|nr:MAG: hypothetical protein DRJ40_06490 [Thermoprotei archaeon]
MRIPLYLTLPFDIGSGIVAFLVGYYALKAYRFSGRFSLLLFSIGFIVLASSFVGRGVVLSSVLVSRPTIALAKLIAANAFLVSIIFELLAYVLISVSYCSVLKEKVGTKVGTIAPTAIPLVLSVNIVICVVNLMLLLFIVFSQAMVYLGSKKRSSLLVLFAFTSILTGQLLHLTALLFLTPLIYVMSRVVCFIGFLIILYILYVVTPREKA